MAFTPNLDALADEGAVFLKHYATSAPCSPARASLYTGLYQMNHRVVRNGTPLDPRFDTITKAARRAGYVPTLFGYTDTAHDPRARPADDPGLRSYEEVLPGFEVGVNLREDDLAWFEWCAANGIAIDRAAPHVIAGEGRIPMGASAYGRNETQSAFLVERCLAWAGVQQKPWFAHLSFLRPHPPFAVPAPYNNLIDPETVPKPVAAPQGGFSATHPLVAGMRQMGKLRSYLPGHDAAVSDLSELDFQRLRALYLGMIAEVDAQIGRLTAGLRALGQWDNTFVVFTSDHAEMLGDHGVMGKGGFYHESYHIPLILRDPDGGLSGLVDGFTSGVDIFPTLCARMGISPQTYVDGMSLLGGASRDYALWEFDLRAGLTPERLAELDIAPASCGVLTHRTADRQYVHSPGFDPILFDLQSDPHCLKPVSDPLRIGQAAADMLSCRMAHYDDTLANITLTADGPRSYLA